MQKKQSQNNSPVIKNRRAWHDYSIEEEYEAGIKLTGSEVKSLRTGKATISDSHIEPKTNAKGNWELWWVNSYIAPYDNVGKYFQHSPYDKRKLLLNRREIDKIAGKVKIKGYTIIPLTLYFNAKGIAKLKIGLASGKAKHDKRASIKERDWNRQKQRIEKYKE